MNYPQHWRTSGIALLLLLSVLAVPSLRAAGHTVRKGETFTSIAKRYKVSVAALQKANPKVTPGVIAKGQSLNVPGPAAKPSPVPAKVPKAAPPRSKQTQLLKSFKPDSRVPEATRLIANKPVKRSPANPITTYRVRSGDTATSLAKRSGISVGELAEMNGLDRLDLHEGQKLVLPDPDATAPAAGSLVDRENTVDLTPPPRRNQQKETPSRLVPSANPPTTPGTYYHVVKRGETFSSIARAQGVSVTALTKANQAVNPARLAIGQNLNIPGMQVASRQSVEELIDEAPAGRPTAYRLDASEDGGSSLGMEGSVPSIAYRITGRDNPETLAREFNTTPADLRHLNQMGPFDQFTPGSFIKVPWQNPSRHD